MAYKAIQPCDNIDGIIARAFLSLINVLVVQKTELMSSSEGSYPLDYGPKLIPEPKFEFDFIIVGSGVAGSVIARRMSDYLDFRVLLLEAGSVPSVTSNVPYVFYNLPFTREDWNFRTNKQNNVCQGFKDKVCTIHKGKLVGGTSSINNMHYIRANQRDFDRWHIDVEEKWTMETIEPLYKSLERCRSSECCGYGKDGLIHLDSITDKSHHVLDLLLEGIKAIGSDNVTDSAKKLGYFHTKAFLKDGQRYNYAKAFLSSIKSRTNLYFAQNTEVSKILFSPDKKVSGVKALVGGQMVTIRAKREVILAAGALNTPKILMVSGIGKNKIIEHAGIRQIAEVPVGDNLQIQLTFPIFVGLKHNIDESKQQSEIIDHIYEYVVHKRGKVAKTNVHGLVGFLNLRNIPLDSPNVQMHHYYFRKRDVLLEDYLRKLNFQKEIIKSLARHNHEYSIIIFMPTLLKPKSRGSVLLNCTNPEGNPSIKAKFFSDPENEDFQTLLASFHYVLKLIETVPYMRYKATLLNVDIPHCRNHKFYTEFYMKCMIKSLSFPSSNVVGTAKMGDNCEEDSVVDENMLVRGVRGLRVADASVFPELVSGNIQATEAVIAERAAEYMRKKWVKNYIPRFPFKKYSHSTSLYSSLYSCGDF